MSMGETSIAGERNYTVERSTWCQTVNASGVGGVIGGRAKRHRRAEKTYGCGYNFSRNQTCGGHEDHGPACMGRKKGLTMQVAA